MFFGQTFFRPAPMKGFFKKPWVFSVNKLRTEKVFGPPGKGKKGGGKNLIFPVKRPTRALSKNLIHGLKLGEKTGPKGIFFGGGKKVFPWKKTRRILVMG